MFLPRTCSGLAERGVIRQARDALGSNQDISRLEVAVNDQVLMGIVDGSADVLEESEALGGAELVRVAVGVDRLPLNVLHDEVGERIFGGAAIQQAGDIGMVQAGQDLALTATILDDVFSVLAALDELDGHFFLKGPIGTGGQVHGTHTSLADFSNDLIRTDVLAGV